MNEMKEWYHRNQRRGRIAAGLILVVIGGVLLAGKMGLYIPEWVFSWPMLVIAIGVFVGARHGFRSPGWLIPVVIGGVFLIDKIYPGTPLKPYIIPALIIFIGLVMIFKPRSKWKNKWKEEHWRNWREHHENRSYGSGYNYGNASSEDYIDSVAVFGGVKKTIISKDFKGGEITCVFGGSEINMMQADINGKVVLEATQVFGGTKLIIPPHWQLQPEMTAIMGGIEDKRPLTSNADPNKVLVIKGTTLFGGIEIRSY